MRGAITLITLLVLTQMAPVEAKEHPKLRGLKRAVQKTALATCRVVGAVCQGAAKLPPETVAQTITGVAPGQQFVPAPVLTIDRSPHTYQVTDWDHALDMPKTITVQQLY